MDKVIYKISYPDLWWDCEIEIDHNHPNICNSIKEMVEFWVGWKERLIDNEGDYDKTFLKQLAREILMIQVANNYNINGIISEFNNNEGWVKMDGSNGVRILSVSEVEFEDEDFHITKPDGTCL